MLDPLVLPFLASFLAAALLTPLVGRAAARAGRISPPNPNVDGHTRATPHLGGVAVFLATMPFLLSGRHAAWAAGAGLAMLVGLADDLRPLSPRGKLLGQAAAAGVMVAGGIRFDLSGVLALDAALTVVWLVFVPNAFNVTDMMDGLAAGTGGIAAVGFAVALTVLGRAESAPVAAALAGGLFGFLVHNFHPARIFMGDTGSLFAGSVLGVSAVLAQREGAGLGGILLLGFPLFEAIFLIVVRTRQGRRWYLASRDHTAQRLVQAGFSIRGAVLLLYAAAACCGMGALFAVGRTTSVSSLVAGVAAGCGLLAGWRLAKVRMG
jgi:UDP-GlcNAc:undecaprenyl-phosphate GlcNAc-1-phosphate transferase